MIEYFREGGVTMWLLVLAAAANAAVAALRPAGRRSVFAIGAVLSLGLGLLGVSLGLSAVSQHFQRFPNPAVAIGIGLGELSHNGTLAVGLALLQGVAALAFEPPSKTHA